MRARIDTANRSFISLLALVIAASLVAGLIGCCVIGVVLYRFGNDGLNAVDKPGTVPALSCSASLVPAPSSAVGRCAARRPARLV